MRSKRLWQMWKPTFNSSLTRLLRKITGEMIQIVPSTEEKVSSILLFTACTSLKPFQENVEMWIKTEIKRKERNGPSRSYLGGLKQYCWTQLVFFFPALDFADLSSVFISVSDLFLDVGYSFLDWFKIGIFGRLAVKISLLSSFFADRTSAPRDLISGCAGLSYFVGSTTVVSLYLPYISSFVEFNRFLPFNVHLWHASRRREI